MSVAEKPVRATKRRGAAMATTTKARRRLTARELLNSGLVGIWKDRQDIPDSQTFARELRERAQRRRGG
ncbi:MAG: hypothetical protein FJ290_16685 [Planctomycetes bacterium]|nr:hypothetical protein [Planctomycetota bacterium]